MISTTIANNILTYLFSQQMITLAHNTSLYIGLCENAPGADGELEDAGEPAITISNPETEKEQETGYKRISLINYNPGTYNDKTHLYDGRSLTAKYFGAANNGKITNNKEEIKFNAARVDWGKMTYWFISKDSSGGSAILWGTIKDIIQEEISVDIPVDIQIGEHEEKIVTTEIENDGLITLAEKTQYIVNFNGTDYTLTSSEKSIITINDDNYVCLNFECLNAIKGLDKDHPFKIQYWTSGNAIDGFKTHYKIISFVNDNEIEQESITRKFGIYGIGIAIKRNTVPTFFKDQLTAEIKVNQE